MLSPATVAVAGCTITGATNANAWDAGVCGYQSTLAVTNSTISGNYNGVYAYGSEVTISGCTISQNSNYGVYDNGGSGDALAITGTAASGNSVCGVYASSAGVTITSSTISGNGSSSGGYGGIYSSGGAITVANSTVANNGGVSTAFGGIYNSSGTLVVHDSTIAGNQSDSSSGGAGIYDSSGSVTLANTIMAENTDNNANGNSPDVYGATITANYCLVGNQYVAYPFGPGSGNNILWPGAVACRAGRPRRPGHARRHPYADHAGTGRQCKY